MSNNENSGNNGGSEYGGNADVGASIDILLVIKSLRIRMSCEEVLEFIRKIRNGSTIISEAENILRTEKGFIEADANNLVKQIIDYDKYHRDLGQAEDTWNLNNECRLLCGYNYLTKLVIDMSSYDQMSSFELKQ